MTKKRVFVGLSGGVDSAVSAALLKREGYDVTGVFITIAIPGYPCPAAADRLEAMRVAAHLDIPFKEINLSNEYEQEVFKPSIEEWREGRTPNPDTLCNEKIKFGIFFDWCIRQGADYVATGHYARLSRPPKAPALRRDIRNISVARSEKRINSLSFAPLRDKRHSSEQDFARPELLVSADESKDQTYFLWAVPEAKLQKCLFPVGSLQKSEVRALAKKFSLPNALRRDSQGLCFLGPISLEDMIEHELPQKPGDVFDEKGAVVGEHKGVAHYTLGQRHGFALRAVSPATEPHFVVAKDVQANTITVSIDRVPRSKTKIIIAVNEANWIGQVEKGPCLARFRYRQTLIPATLVTKEDGTVVELHEPHYVPEGQSLVLYKGERCLGGGIISSATLK